MSVALLLWAPTSIAALLNCPEGKTSLYDRALLLEDVERALGAAEVLALPLSAFRSYQAGPPAWRFTQSAIWFRFSLQNRGSESCVRWLTVGESRLENVQVHTRRSGVWAFEQAGSLVPLEQWNHAARQPRFELVLQPGERVDVLVRVKSRSLMWLMPTLWGQHTLIEATSAEQMLDGVTIGAVVLIVLIGLVVGTLLRSKLLLLNGLVLLSYGAFTLSVDGYLFYLPELLPWSREVIAVLSAITFGLGYFFIFLLFRMRFLDRWFNVLVLSFVVVMVWVLLQGALGDFLVSRQRFYSLVAGVYILVPAALMLAFWRRVPVSWLAWLLCLEMSLQGGLWAWRTLSGDYELGVLDGFTLQSSVFLALLLVCTLASEARQLWRRERDASEEVAAILAAEQERLESKVEQRTAQLRESLDARSTLLGQISHDLRSPLGSILNAVHDARTGAPAIHLERIERLAGQQLGLLDDLIALSRAELQHIELSLAPGYLHGFLREIEGEGSYLAQRRNNVLRCEFAADLPAIVSADFQQLRRVLMNLLSNAAKFTSDGLIVLQVGVRSGASGAVLYFCVRDSGVGFPAESSYQMVRAFQRGRNATGIDGVGLGLSIVVELLKQMGSELRIDSGPEGGSVFYFEVTLEEASEEEVDFVFRENHTSGVQGDGCSILLVDDVELTRVFLSELLLGYGFDVTAVASAEQALVELEQGWVDLLISDQLMPGVDGWELLRMVRSRFPDLPALLYSSTPPSPQPSQRDLAFDAALLKPASTDALLEHIQRLCRCCMGQGKVSSITDPAGSDC